MKPERQEYFRKIADQFTIKDYIHEALDALEAQAADIKRLEAELDKHSPPPSVMCQASACHCNHAREAEYVVTMPGNGVDELVSVACANLHIVAGYACRKVTDDELRKAASDELKDKGE